MPTRSENFYHGTVKPTVTECFAEPNNLRRGRLAAIVLYHMADYWAIENSEHYASLSALHLDLIAECPDFLFVRDIADASEHDRLTPQKKIPRQLSTSEQVSKHPGIFEAPFGTAVFNEAPRVMMTLDNGQSRPLVGVLRSVMNMWEPKLGIPND